MGFKTSNYFLLVITLINIISVQRDDSFITIVDIGHLGRNGISNELNIINRYSPKVVGLDFLLSTDSLDKDAALSEEISRTKSMIQASILRDNDPSQQSAWNNLEKYHLKFSGGKHGFTNITITQGKVLVPEIPMRQYFMNKLELAFSYQVAMAYDSAKVNVLYKTGDKDFIFKRNLFGHKYKVISVTDLMRGKFDKADLTNKIVLMGHLGDIEDSFYLDDRSDSQLNGVEIQANIIYQILN